MITREIEVNIDIKNVLTRNAEHDQELEVEMEEFIVMKVNIN